LDLGTSRAAIDVASKRRARRRESLYSEVHGVAKAKQEAQDGSCK
jgi:hypothetical protein